MKLTLEQQKLVEDNYNLIYGCAEYYMIDLEEYSGLLSIGLCKAAYVFDESKGKFSTIAYIAMATEYNKYIRGLLRNKRKVNLNLISLDKKYDEQISLLETIPDEKDSYEDVDFLESLRNILNPFHFEIIKLLIKGLNKTEVTKTLGISRPTLDKKIDQIKEIFLKNKEISDILNIERFREEAE